MRCRPCHRDFARGGRSTITAAGSSGGFIFANYSYGRLPIVRFHRPSVRHGRRMQGVAGNSNIPSLSSLVQPLGFSSRLSLSLRTYLRATPLSSSRGGRGKGESERNVVGFVFFKWRGVKTCYDGVFGRLPRVDFRPVAL